MDSPIGNNIKDKFRKLPLFNRQKTGSENSPGTPGNNRENTLAEFEDFLNQDFQRKASAISTNRGRIHGPLNDFEEEEVLKSLEQLYYDEEFDPTPHELSKFPPNFDQAAVDVQRQRLLRQLKVVTKRVFTQILEKRPECNHEFENVRKLQQEVAFALQSVQRGREGLGLARNKSTASSLGILAAYRRRQRARILLDNLVIISTLKSTGMN